jgi:hypothetical protein
MVEPNHDGSDLSNLNDLNDALGIDRDKNWRPGLTYGSCKGKVVVHSIYLPAQVSSQAQGDDGINKT